MPPPYVKTIKEEIFYEYAKLISKSARGKIVHPFVADRFKKLRDGEITMSGTIREWEKEWNSPKECVFCGTTEKLQRDHLIPRSRGGSDSTDNIVWACSSCNQSRGNKGIFQWLGLKKKDDIHRIVAGKYLKELYTLHGEKETLDLHKDNLLIQCDQCRNLETCKIWKKEQELTCFCLENVF